jgi:hypothetical protein
MNVKEQHRVSSLLDGPLVFFDSATHPLASRTYECRPLCGICCVVSFAASGRVVLPERPALPALSLSPSTGFFSPETRVRIPVAVPWNPALPSGIRHVRGQLAPFLAPVQPYSSSWAETWRQIGRSLAAPRDLLVTPAHNPWDGGSNPPRPTVRKPRSGEGVFSWPKSSSASPIPAREARDWARRALMLNGTGDGRLHVTSVGTCGTRPAVADLRDRR